MIKFFYLIKDIFYIFISMLVFVSLIVYLDKFFTTLFLNDIFRYTFGTIILLIMVFLLYFIFDRIKELYSKLFDENHSLINASLPIVITTISAIILFIIGSTTSNASFNDNNITNATINVNSTLLQQQFFVHLALIVTILSLLFYVIDFLMTIKKQNQLVNYMLVKNKNVFPKLFKIYKSFNEMNEKENISKLEEELFNDELDKISGNIQDISRGKYELKSAKFNLFWVDIIKTLKRKKNAKYYSITDFSQDGNLTNDRLASLEDSLDKFEELNNLEIRKLIICSDKVKELGNETKQRIYSMISNWDEVARDETNNMDLKYINYNDIFDDLIGKNLDIGIFEDIAVGFQLSANSSSDKNKANSTLRYVIHFDEHYIEKSRIHFNELWDIASKELPEYIKGLDRRT